MLTAPLILFGGGFPQIDILTMEHFLIATTMVVIGLFSVLNWDSIFPDHRGVLVLAPLPVGEPVFPAKLAGLIFSMPVMGHAYWPLRGDLTIDSPDLEKIWIN